MSKKFKLYLFISLISILFSLYSFEGYLNYQEFKQKSINIKKKYF